MNRLGKDWKASRNDALSNKIKIPLKHLKELKKKYCSIK